MKSIPGFVAEASLYQQNERYHSVATFAADGSRAIVPQAIILRRDCTQCGGTIKDGKCTSNDAGVSECITGLSRTYGGVIESLLQYVGFLAS